MRRPECTVKSNITRHSWHTALPPRKTSPRSALALEYTAWYSEDAWRDISTLREKGDMHLDRTALSRYMLISLLSLPFSFVNHFYANNPLCVFLRTSLIRWAKLHFVYQFRAINSLGCFLITFWREISWRYTRKAWTVECIYVNVYTVLFTDATKGTVAFWKLCHTYNDTYTWFSIVRCNMHVITKEYRMHNYYCIILFDIYDVNY